MKRRRRTLGDLPQDILGFIYGKSDAVDVIRFRAVCKNWLNVDLPPRNLPWPCNLSWSKGGIKCEMHDPYSGQIFVTWKEVKSRYRYTHDSNRITCFGTSNEGWLIAGYSSNFHLMKWGIFIYNPYTKHFISLPCICYNPSFATFSAGNREIFLFSCTQNPNNIASYFLNGAKKEWTIDCVGATQVRCRGLQFVKGQEQKQKQLLRLFSDGTMRSYSLSSSSSHRLAEGDQRLWLAKGDGDLLVACELDDSNGDEWSTFYFDWSSMRWTVSDLRVISAGTYVGRPFAGKVHLVREGEHSNVRGVHDLDTVFIEPPRIRRCLQTLY